MGAWGVVYVATNTLTGEQYVGQTKQPPHVRFRAHEISSRNPKTGFHRVVAAMGYDKFCFEVVASSLTREALNEAEKTIIADRQPTYNTTRGGAGRPRTVSGAERVRMSESAKLRWSNPEWRGKTVASIRKAAATETYKTLGRDLGRTGAGAKARWEGHTPASPTPKNRSASISMSWYDPDIRARRIAGLTKANSRPEVRAKRSMAGRNRVMPKEAVIASARKRWKPVYCPELQVTFLSRSAAAEYIGVGKTAISQALRHDRKIAGKYTLREVSYRL